jgi:Xaa-Pro aminopeptidase
MTSTYAQRRAALAAQVGAGGVAIIPTAPAIQIPNKKAFIPL